MQPGRVAVKRLAAEFRPLEHAQQVEERHLRWPGDQGVEVGGIQVARPGHAGGGVDAGRCDLGAGDVEQHPAIALGYGARRLDLGGQVAVSVAPEDGQVAQLGASGVDRPDPENLVAVAKPGLVRSVTVRVVVADAPGAQLPAGDRLGLVLDQELESADQQGDRQDGAGEPDLGHAAGVDRGELTVPRQLGEAHETGEEGGDRNQLGQNRRQAQHHVECQGAHRMIARRDHLIAVGEELQKHHQRRQPEQQDGEAAEHKPCDVAGDD